MPTIREKINAIYDYIQADSYLKLFYPFDFVKNNDDWSTLPKNIKGSFGTFHIDTSDPSYVERMTEYYDIDPSKWQLFGFYSDDLIILLNIATKQLEVLDPHDYELALFPVRTFSNYREFMDDYVLGERYLELSNGYKDRWYELLQKLSFVSDEKEN